MCVCIGLLCSTVLRYTNTVYYYYYYYYYNIITVQSVSLTFGSVCLVNDSWEHVSTFYVEVVVRAVHIRGDDGSVLVAIHLMVRPMDTHTHTHTHTRTSQFTHSKCVFCVCITHSPLWSVWLSLRHGWGCTQVKLRLNQPSEGAEPEGKTLDLQVHLRSNPHLWSRALGSDRKNEIADTSGRNEFPPQGGWTQP